MKLVTYQVEKKTRVGVLSRDEEWVFPIESFGMEYNCMLDLVRELCDSEAQLLEHASGKDPYSVKGSVAMEAVRLLAPIPHPDQDIICLGVNYIEHAAESARFKNEEFNGERPHAVYFSKRVYEAIADGDDIQGHWDIVDSLDYEAELAVVIGKNARDVAPEDARDYIFGYTIINDVSARNIQNRHKQWYFGKSLDGFTPMGPCIVSADALPYPPKLRIQSYINGELRQDSNTDSLIFDIDYVLAELSRGMTLKAGTIISTGTPAGVGLGFDPPRFMKPGDVVECQIEGIGRLRNRVE